MEVSSLKGLPKIRFYSVQIGCERERSLLSLTFPGTLNSSNEIEVVNGSHIGPNTSLTPIYLNLDEGD